MVWSMQLRCRSTATSPPSLPSFAHMSKIRRVKLVKRVFHHHFHPTWPQSLATSSAYGASWTKGFHTSWMKSMLFGTNQQSPMLEQTMKTVSSIKIIILLSSPTLIVQIYCYNIIFLVFRSCTTSASFSHQMERWQWTHSKILSHGLDRIQLANSRRAPWPSLLQAWEHCNWISRQAQGVLPSYSGSVVGQSSSRLPHHMAWTPGTAWGQSARPGRHWTQGNSGQS